MNEALAPRGFLPEDQAVAKLYHYVFRFDIRADALPKDINPLHTTLFIRERLQDSIADPGAAERVTELADFYHLTELVPDFLQTLDREEKTVDQYLVSLAYTRLIGILGDPGQREKGKSCYRYLLTHPLSETRMADLIRCYDAYSPDESDSAITDRFDTLIDEFKKRADGDVGAGVAMRELQDLKNNVLPRVAKADSMRSEIQSLQNSNDYRDRLTGLYLNLTTHYAEFLKRWAVRMLLQDVRNNGPQGVIASFRRALPRIEELDEPAEARRAYRAVALRAIEYFGGSLDAAEKTEASSLPPHLAGLLSVNP